MGSKGKLPFDLNEPPAEDDDDDGVFFFQPQKAVPSLSSHTSDLFTASSSAQGIVNNNAFSHASTVSGFQPFVRPASAKASEQPIGRDSPENETNTTGRLEDVKTTSCLVDSTSADPQTVEKEEGEWSDADDSKEVAVNNYRNEESTTSANESLKERGVAVIENHIIDRTMVKEDVSQKVEDVNDQKAELGVSGQDQDTNDRKSNNSRTSEGSSMNGQEDSGLVPKQREIRGVEASYAHKAANNPIKRSRIDQQKEAMLGKKRSRQTMFLNLEDVKQVGNGKSLTPRRLPPPVTTRTIKEGRSALATSDRTAEKQIQTSNKDMTQVDTSSNEGNGYAESNDSRSDCNGETSGPFSRPRRLNSSADLAGDSQSSSVSRQSSWKQPTDSRPLRTAQPPVRKPPSSSLSLDPKIGAKKVPIKKQPAVNNLYQDTSVERLLREVTNEKFWQHPGPCSAEGILELHLRKQNFSVYQVALNLQKSTSEYLSLCFLRNAVHSCTVPGRNQQKQIHHM